MIPFYGKGRKYDEKRIFIISVLVTIAQISGVLADEVKYPYTASYTNGITQLNESLLKTEKRNKNLTEDFETQEEIKKITENSFDGQLTVTENCSQGKFALMLKQTGDDILPVSESDYFHTNSLNNTTKKTKASVNNGSVSITADGLKITVQGKCSGNKDVTVLACTGKEVAYINQCKSDENGSYSFAFNVRKYDTYTVKVNDGEIHLKNINLSGESLPDDSDAAKSVESKSNIITLMLKPMYKSERISFYTKAKVLNESGSESEQYIQIKSDKNKDGDFEIGNDLSLGSWQQVRLCLDDIDEDIIGDTVSGIYAKANIGSEWIIDDVSSGYEKLNTAEIDLSNFANSNVIYKDGALRFKIENNKYNTAGKIVSSSVDINEKIDSINISSSTERINNYDITYDELNTTLLEADFADDAWSVNDENYDSQQSNAGKKVTDGGSTKICLKSYGSAEFDAADFSTQDRTKIMVKMHPAQGSFQNSELFKIEMFEKGSTVPYYTAKKNLYLQSESECVSFIIPKVKQNTVFRLTAEGGGYQNIKTLNSFEIVSLAERDWNKEIKYAKRGLTNKTSYADHYNLTSVKASDLENYAGNEYALKHKDVKGGIYKSGDITFSDAKFNCVVRVVNLSNESKIIILNGGSYWLDYGESDLDVNVSRGIGIPNDPNVMLVSITEYDNEESIIDNLQYQRIDGMGKIHKITDDGNTVFYANYYDGQALYSYNTETKEYHKLADVPVTDIAVNGSGTEAVYKSSSNAYLYSSETQKSVQITNAEEYIFNSQGELYALLYDGIYLISKDTSEKQFSVSTQYYRETKFAFDSTGNYMAVCQRTGTKSYYYSILKKYNNMWSGIAGGSLSGDYREYVYLSDDLSAIYTGNGEVIDIKTSVKKDTVETVAYKAKDNTFILNGLKIYNPATGEKLNMINANYENLYYNPDTSILTIINSGTVAKFKYSSEKSSAKYLFSFDGKNTWSSYKNGRWVTASKSIVPSAEEIDALGMPADEVNSITKSCYDLLYENGRDILSLDIAIYMNSNSNEITPKINKITLKTADDNENNDLFAVNAAEYNKQDYKSVSSIFPIEELKGNAECYYLLYLGQDWVYTYKNGEIIKISENADELFSSVGNTWLNFKQYGMTAKEVRNIPENVLTDLLVNDDYANTKFGVIYVVKSESEQNPDSISFKIQANKAFIHNDDIVLEILMNGNDKKIIDSEEFSKDNIDDFMKWLENRQSGKGDIFYNLKNSRIQYLINYYMINSVNIYNGEEYRNISEE